MFEELIGKVVTVNMLFSSSGLDFGVSPSSYTGKVIEVKDGFIKLHVTSSNITYDGSMNTLRIAKTTTMKEPVNNIMYFNINSISYIKL